MSVSGGQRAKRVDYGNDPYLPKYAEGYGDPNMEFVTNTANAYQAKQQKGPYRGGLLTDFRGFDPGSYDGYAGSNRQLNNAYAMGDADADVRGAAAAQNELDKESAGDTGVSSAEQLALLNMYKGRIGTKNSLAESIQGNATNERKQEDLLTGAAGQALGEGVKNTRQNYNSRGLLYSGLRQGGEQQVRQGVASSLSSGISASKREAANSLSSAQNAYAAVDLANAQESLNLAHQAFDTANANNIARLQAMQQLGRGVGSVVGMFAGNASAKPAQTTQPSGPSNYNTSSTGDYYDNGGFDASRIA